MNTDANAYYADMLNSNKEHTLTSAFKGQREARRIMSWVRTPSENNPGPSFQDCPNGKATHDS